MSSNAFARSRPRVRHQRVPRTHSCEHPRFLQLVNELARLDEEKKKKQHHHQEATDDCKTNDSACTANCNNDQTLKLTDNRNQNASRDTCTSSACSANFDSCCQPATGSHSSNGYRSLEQSTASTLQPNYQLLPIHAQQQQHLTHNDSYNSQHHYNQHHIRHPNQSSSQHVHEDRFPSKYASASSFAIAKQNLLVDQGTSDFSNDNSDLRQDENRSKRKRSNNDPNSCRKSSAASCSVGGASSKRLKSATETTRPLSPSFTKCPICLLDSMDRDPSFTNTCFHLFCYSCIENWSKNKSTCPLCRTKFSKIIYNIKSATVYDEKIASPIRRDDDDAYIPDRLMLEQLTGFNSSVSNRNVNNDEVQFLFENLRNPEALMQQPFMNQISSRAQSGEQLHSFTAVTSSANFNVNVPHHLPYTTSYPMTSNYILHFPDRIAPAASAAITSAYSANANFSTIDTDPSNRRMQRSSRNFAMYGTRGYENLTIDGSSRSAPRSSNPVMNQPSASADRHHHHHHQTYQHAGHYQHHHQHGQHRISIEMNQRQNQRSEPIHTHIQMAPAGIQPRQIPYYPSRRIFNNPQVEQQQHLLDSVFRPLPEM